MFLCALQPYVVLIIIAAVLLQYAFAVFCLLKLAYINVDKKRYILWNLLILIVVYIGSVVFLVYYNKHPELRITNDVPTESNEQKQEDDASAPESTDNETTDTDSTENG